MHAYSTPDLNTSSPVTLSLYELTAPDSKAGAYRNTNKTMNKVPGFSNLYIGGLDALDDLDALDQAHITHILSILEFDYCDYPEFEKYQRMLVQLEDHPGQSLFNYFNATNAFIEQAVEGGAVLVHCAMGQSRSATIVCAYMMFKLRISASQALELLKEARPTCEPNDGFTAQLLEYERVLGVEEKK